MPNQKDNNSTFTTPWQAESLRATAFPSPDTQFDSKNWWASVVGENPDTHVDNINIGVKETQGTFHGTKLSLKVHAARIDWTLTPNPQATDSPFSLLTLGSFEEKCADFCDLLKKWFPLSPSLSRLAFGTMVYLPAESKEDSYDKLQAYLPTVTLDRNSSDFTYRINRPRESKSGIEGLKINRLSTWMAIRVEFGQFTVGPHGGVKGIPVAKPMDACRVELDINTAQEYEGQIASDQSLKVFIELVELTREILREGDRP